MTLLATLETLTKAVKDVQEKVESQGKELEEAQKAIIKYARTSDAHTIEVRSMVLDKWAGRPISYIRRS